MSEFDVIFEETVIDIYSLKNIEKAFEDIETIDDLISYNENSYLIFGEVGS
jgi:hypothetical protein